MNEDIKTSEKKIHESSAKETDEVTNSQFVRFGTHIENSSKKRGTRSALKKSRKMKHSRSNSVESDNDLDTMIVSSPLLTSTPPTIARSLAKLYPYLIVTDKALSLITWTNDEAWPSVVLVFIYVLTILHYETFTKYFGHLIVIESLWLYSLLDKYVTEQVSAYPTLDDIVHVMNRVSLKADMMLSPINILTTQDIRRILFTNTFFSSNYIIISFFIIPPIKLLLISGVFALTYHSPWAKHMRRILWRFRAVRLFIFYLTGLDLDGVNKHQRIFYNVAKQLQNMPTKGNGSNTGLNKVRFTYVLYENQRRWLGIGWTSTLMAYERAPWTDEFLNTVPEPGLFKLPEDDSNMRWRWVDKTWRLDMTNAGAIQLSSSKAKTTASPDANAAFIYFDNTWKKPTTEDTYTKYTRRRRWIRTAELICPSGTVQSAESTSSVTSVISKEPGGKNSTDDREGDTVLFEDMSDKKDRTDISSLSGGNRKRKVSFSNVKNIRIIPSTNDEDERYEKENIQDESEPFNEFITPTSEESGTIHESISKTEGRTLEAAKENLPDAPFEKDAKKTNGKDNETLIEMAASKNDNFKKDKTIIEVNDYNNIDINMQ
ncbi:hypothetical protein KAFR_0F03280 [Kazachstania africana CBS 2517]|uniref:Peroxin/Ferlin domain-containing protein n=1 Tax=Kazachstania africana (strain ATCC 22294 / BCRC 22015 / CBS 2517 / CECT 1963 / NBRC 1671 / NRRL Y-8276) TaxID=1071382 RepID=H2AX24_KAZAF|nr:hypothetical protein KAFR_0F03280 [Kazachstania africana CBS 2517]CCF58924.1 hypothetical protein KAFR_0F03280 [Kazachstania africana CBS 2517]